MTTHSTSLDNNKPITTSVVLVSCLHVQLVIVILHAKTAQLQYFLLLQLQLRYSFQYFPLHFSLVLAQLLKVSEGLVLLRSKVSSSYTETLILLFLSLLIFCQSDICNSPWSLPASESQKCYTINVHVSISAFNVQILLQLVCHIAEISSAHMDDVISVIQCEPRRTHDLRSHHSLFCLRF